jgi:hypothetical protein
MTGLASLILHLGGKEILMDNLASLTDQAEAEALQLHAVTRMTDDVKSNDDHPKGAENTTPEVLQSPPEKPKPSLKVGKFFPIFADTTPPRRINDASPIEDDEDSGEPGIYSKTQDGAGDGTHYITASFVKSNDKIKDQLLSHFKYFLELMCANIDGLKIHPVNTERKLPILTSASDKNIPITGTKIRDYFFVQNEFSLIPGTRNKPKVPPQKVDSDGRLQFDENRVYDGPDRITGIMSISAPCNVRQAIGNLLIELEGDVHQIRYKPTQRKNSKA